MNLEDNTRFRIINKPTQRVLPDDSVREEVIKSYTDTLLTVCRKIDKMVVDVKDVHNEVVDLRKEMKNDLATLTASIRDDFKENREAHDNIKDNCNKRVIACTANNSNMKKEINRSIKEKTDKFIDKQSFYTVISILVIILGGSLFTLLKLFAK